MTYAYYDPTTLPRPGDVVWCHFPLQEMPGHAGPKPRPAIVRRTFLNRRTSRGSVEVAFGTSPKVGKRYEAEVLISSPSGMTAAGLDCVTKFDLSRTVRLPWARDFFVVEPGATRLVMGSLHPSDVIALQRASESKSGP